MRAVVDGRVLAACTCVVLKLAMTMLCRCENLKLPTMGDDGYIKEADGELKGQLQAQEHRSGMQLMPLVVLAAAHDAFDEESTGLPLVELVMRYCPSSSNEI